jgi:hypothetical protein
MTAMALNDGSVVEKVAENVYTRILARYSIILVSAIGLPLIGWTLNAGFNLVKEMNREQITLTTKVDLLAQRFELTSRAQREATAGEFKLRDQIQEQQDRRIADLERRVAR